VLFIDEAYSLVPSNNHYHDYGQDALNVLIKRMEDYRAELAVIVAGYPEEMKHFIESNPGLESRINRSFTFRHYNASELLKIFEGIAAESDYEVHNAARTRLTQVFSAMSKEPERTFGNGRYVRNLFGAIVERHASRLAAGDIKGLSNQQLNCITEDDIPRSGPLVDSKPQRSAENPK